MWAGSLHWCLHPMRCSSPTICNRVWQLLGCSEPSGTERGVTEVHSRCEVWLVSFSVESCLGCFVWMLKEAHQRNDDAVWQRQTFYSKQYSLPTVFCQFEGFFKQKFFKSKERLFLFTSKQNNCARMYLSVKKHHTFLMFPRSKNPLLPLHLLTELLSALVLGCVLHGTD